MAVGAPGRLWRSGRPLAAAAVAVVVPSSVESLPVEAASSTSKDWPTSHDCPLVESDCNPPPEGERSGSTSPPNTCPAQRASRGSSGSARSD